MEIKLNTIFKNNKKELVKVIKVDNKCGTAIVESEDKSTKIYSFGTLNDKRRFTPVAIEELSDTEYAAIGLEIAEQAKEKAKKLVPMPGAEKLADLKEDGKKSRITITYNGKTQSPSEWAKEFGMNPKRIRLALRKGKSPEEIFNGKNQ